MSQQQKAQPQARGQPIPSAPRRHVEDVKSSFARLCYWSPWPQWPPARFTPGSISARTKSTDDAEVDGHINAISARISGYVLDVPVEDEQYVKAGDVLARIDPKDYSVALANARADLAAAEAAFLSSRTDVPITSTTTSSQLKNARSGRADTEAALLGAQRQLSAAQARLDTAEAQVREAQATYKKTADDVARYKLLMDKDEISQQRYDTRRIRIRFRKGDRRRPASRSRRGRTECPRRAERHRSGQRPNRAGGCLNRIRANRAAAGRRQPGAREERRSSGGSKTRGWSNRPNSISATARLSRR